jgi:hypothetical protein
MKIGDITEFGEVSFINYDLSFVQFCKPGSNGILGVYSMSFEEIERAKYNQSFKPTPNSDAA